MPEAIEFQTETCTAFLPKGIVENRDSPAALEKGRKIRNNHIKGEKATAMEFLEVL